MNLIFTCLLSMATFINVAWVLNNQLALSHPDNLPNLSQANNMKSFNLFWNDRSNSSFNQQSTAITVSSRNLQKPHYLTISINSNQIEGKITINNEKIVNLSPSKTSLDLSPYLSPGVNEVEISGNYAPKTARVTVEFSGPGNSVTQQSSGSGVIRHKLVINVL